MNLRGSIKIGRLNNFEIPIIDIILVVIIDVCLVYAKMMPHTVRYIPENDLSLIYPKHFKVVGSKDTLFFYYLLIPFVLICINNLSTKTQYGTFKVLVAYFSSLLITLLVVEIMKIYISRPRPDTKTACKRSHTIYNCSKVRSATVNKKQFKSFPSGGTAGMFSSSLFLGLFLNKVWKKTDVMSITLKLLPLVWCLFSSITRVIGHAHHADDIFGSFIISTLITHFVFKSSLKTVNVEEYEELDQALA